MQLAYKIEYTQRQTDTAEYIITRRPTTDNERHSPANDTAIASVAMTTAAVAKTILIATSISRQRGGQALVGVT